jgi:hypothetical protein
MKMDKIVHENRNSLQKTSDGKHNLMKKWRNMEKKMAPKPIDVFSYLFKSHCCLDQSESKSIIYFWTQFAG